MNRSNIRVFIGGALVILGVLMLLERIGVIRFAVAIFWAVLFLLVGAYFLYRFAMNGNREWWALIPGFALIGMGASAIVSAVLPGNWSGLAFLGFLGISFLAVYFNNRGRWWAIIPAGVLITLGVTAVLTDAYGARETGGIFFLGLGLTFLLLAVLASLQWAYIPGVILLLMGVLLGYTQFTGVFNYVWPAALILVGLLLIFQFTRPK
jgi:hypothetical protein